MTFSITILIYPTMQEINDIIIAINRLKEKVAELSSRIDNLSATPLQQLNAKYLDEASACKILHVCPRILAQMRSSREIPYIKIRRRFLYQASDLNDYLEKNCKKT
jgi:hypothetical protein